MSGESDAQSKDEPHHFPRLLSLVLALRVGLAAFPCGRRRISFEQSQLNANAGCFRKAASGDRIRTCIT
jgi:hypothetical protein